MPEYLGTVFASDPEPGVCELNLTLELPEGWSESVTTQSGHSGYGSNAPIADIAGVILGSRRADGVSVRSR